MKIMKEIWNGYFSQLGVFEIAVYLIAFSCISGFSIAVSLYHLGGKPPLTPGLPVGKQQDQYRQRYPMNRSLAQPNTKDIEATRPSNHDPDKRGAPKTENNNRPNLGDRRQ